MLTEFMFVYCESLLWDEQIFRNMFDLDRMQNGVVTDTCQK
jgi:hypothetical protein